MADATDPPNSVTRHANSQANSQTSSQTNFQTNFQTNQADVRLSPSGGSSRDGVANEVDGPLSVCVMGPTAVGKTAVACRLSELFPVELISVDSAMVYRTMDIGTGKPDRAELARYPHHLINVCDPSAPYSAAAFAADAQAAMNGARRRQRVPLLVGGTGLYFRALRDGLSPLPAADSTVRQRLDEAADELGADAMHARLCEVDPVAGRKIHRNDRQRVQRALEVFEITGRPWSEMLGEGQPAPAAGGLDFVIVPRDRRGLHRAIEYRFRAMLDAGLVDEVAALRRREDLHPDLPSMRSVGYRQVWNYLDGDLTYEEMVEKSLAATRQLARRQLTWLRSQKATMWIPIDVDALLSEPAPAIEAAVTTIARRLARVLERQ